MRKKIIVGNWKMNNGPQKAHTFLHDLENELFNKKVDIDWAIAAPFISLPYMMPHSHGDSKPFEMPLAAQNVHSELSGAFTGETSISMLKELGVEYVIIGHSERREYFSESNDFINKKLKLTLKETLTPILAFGETLEEFENNLTLEVIKKQLDEGMKDIMPNELQKIVLAYEPIWAIGTGKTATSKQAQDTIKSIRDYLKEKFNEEAAESVRIQYGGSVNPENIKELMEQPDIDGALVGGASLEPQTFSKLLLFNK